MYLYATSQDSADKVRKELGVPSIDTVFSQARNGRVKRVEESLNQGEINFRQHTSFLLLIFWFNISIPVNLSQPSFSFFARRLQNRHRGRKRQHLAAAGCAEQQPQAGGDARRTRRQCEPPERIRQHR
jgi:hypothetical protein